MRRPLLHCMTLLGIVVTGSIYPFARAALASDHGVMGQTWGIAEPDLLSTIDTRLKALQANGSVARMQAALAAKAESRVRNPQPVAGIGAAREERRWTFDPSIVLEHDIRDQNGRLVAPAGQRVNPLALVAMKTDLVFIDGRDDAQVDWATRRWKAAGAKIIFVSGSPFERMGERKRRFFFDQQGALTGHFGIAHVPAIVTQSGDKLQVSEIAFSGAAS